MRNSDIKLRPLLGKTEWLLLFGMIATVSALAFLVTVLIQSW